MSGFKAYQKEIELQLLAWEAYLEKLKKKAEQEGDQLSVSLERDIRELETSIAQGKEALKQLTQLDDSVTEELKEEMENRLKSFLEGPGRR